MSPNKINIEKELMYKPKVYLSGGFKTGWQNMVRESLNDSCIIFDPGIHNLSSDEQYWAWDIHFVRQCDIVFAYMEDSNPSGFGLTLEIGMAFALNKTVILVDEKSKGNPEFERYFKIVSNSASIKFDNMLEGVEYLKTLTTKCNAVR